MRSTRMHTILPALALLLVVAICGVPSRAAGQALPGATFDVSYLTSREGLPQNSAYDMLQDEFGFVWIATQTGIARYDGRNFIEFPFKKLASGTGEGSRYDNFLCEHTILRQDTFLNVLWVAACNSLYGISTTSNEYWPVSTDREVEITGMVLRGSGNLVLGTAHGMLGLEWTRPWTEASLFPFDDHVRGKSRLDSILPLLLVDRRITSMYEKGNERDWLVGTDLGVIEVMGGREYHAGTLTHGRGSGRQAYTANAVAFRPKQGFFGGKPDPAYLEYEVWAASDDSVYVYHEIGELKAAFALRGVNFIAPLKPDANGLSDKMMLGTEYDGLVLIGGENEMDGGSGYHAVDRSDPDYNWPGRIRGNEIRSSLVTRDGAIWIGTRGMGITRVVERTQAFFHHFRPFDLPGRIPNNYVWAIWRASESDQAVWLGTEGNGLVRYNLLSRQPEAFYEMHPSPHLNIVKAMTGAGDTLWLGGQAGLHYLLWREENALPAAANQIVFGSAAVPLAGRGVSALWYDAGLHRLWVGTASGGLFLLHQGYADKIELPENGLVTFIGPGSGDSVVVATDHGFVQIPRSGLPANLRHGPVYLQSEHLKCVLHEAESGTFWAGTVGNGLVRMQQADGKVGYRYFLSRDGLPDPVVYGILPAGQGSYWLSTNRGLSHFFPRRGIFINYNESDGLQHPEFNTGAFFKIGSSFHFGGVNGFNLFREAAREPDAYLPQVALACFVADTGGKDEKVLLFDTPPDSAPALRLDYDYQYIEFRIVSLQYQDFAKVNYKYRVYPEGDDPSEWTLLKDSPDFTLSQGNGLGSGWFFPRRYIVEVWASDLLGGTGLRDVSEPNGRTLRIVIAVNPPYWQTWWFILSVVLVVLVILVLAFNLYRQNGRLITRHTDLQTAYNNTASLADLNIIGQKIVASLSLEENFEAIMEEIRDLKDLRSDVFAVDLLDEERHELVSRLSIEAGERLGNYAVSLDNPNSLGVACVRLARSGGPYSDGFLINDLDDRSQFPFLEGEPGVQEGRPTRATLFVPLRVGDRVLGAITVQSYLAEVYRPYHLNMLQILGAYIAIAIDHARTTEALLEAERANTRSEQEDLIKALDIKLLRSQLSPHFIFNSLGTIQYLVSEGDPRADEYTAKLGEIMREVMTMITRSDIPLRTEVSFLRDYIEAEKIRFRNEYEFRWRLEIDPAIDPDAVYIPPMLLQPFIENSLEHAFYPLPPDGPEIRLFFGKMDDRLVIVMEDNGIGLGQMNAARPEKHPRKNSTALQNIRRRGELINQLNQDQALKMEIRALDLATAPAEEICRVETWDLPVLVQGARFELHMPFSFKFTATTLND